MGHGFQGAASAPELTEIGPWQTKLEAAKTSILAQIANLRSPDVAIISFNFTPTEVFTGRPSELAEIERRVNSLEPSGGTDLAKALLDVPRLTSLSGYRQIKVLVVSDGLTDGDAAEAAAGRLIEEFRQLTISVLLIDQTEQGNDVARRIATNEEVRYARGQPQFREAVGAEAVQFLQGTALSLLQERRLVLADLFRQQKQPPITTIIFVGLGTMPLTAATLTGELVPVLGALETLQQIANDVAGVESRVKIASITQYNPIETSISGIAKAVEVVEELVTPWRRSHAREMADLKEGKARVDIAKAHAEAVQVAENVEVTKAEARKRQAEAAQIELDNELKKLAAEEMRMRLEIGKMTLVAVKMLASGGQLPPDQRLELESRAFGALETLAKARLMIESSETAPS